MISKACLVGAYQTKLEEIACFEDVELGVVVPPLWDDPAGPVPLERTHTEGYELYVDPMRFNGHFHLHYYPRLRARIAKFQPDIVHMDEEPYNVATWLAVREARRAGVKTLFFSWQNIERHYPLPFNLIENYVLAHVDFAIMGNEAAAEVWRSKGYQGRYRVIPQFGVNPQIFHPPLRRDPGRTFIIGSAGRLVREKGNHILLHAAVGLPGVWRIHIAGTGPERAPLEKLARELGIADRIVFDGVIPSSQMPDYLRQIDALVLPSLTLSNWKEQFGRILVEAMACEVAVIGSDSGEIPNVVGDAGLIFPEGDSEALRAHLHRLMWEDGRRDALGRAGRQRVLGHFTQAQIAARTVEVYREMLGRVMQPTQARADVSTS